MKTSAIASEKHRRRTTNAQEPRSKSVKPSNRSAAEASVPKPEATTKPMRLLLERCPKPDQKRICLEVYAPEAQLVFVAGSFNGWQPSAMPLHKQAGDRWVVELMLDPGKYEYRFVVDGEWTDDPLSSAYVSNPFDGLNSVLLVEIQG
jgi:5'-AMP-activated protein kinase regulatory beta subunit